MNPMMSGMGGMMNGGMGMNGMTPNGRHPVPDITVKELDDNGKEVKKKRRLVTNNIDQDIHENYGDFVSLQKCTNIINDDYMELCVTLNFMDNTISLDVNIATQSEMKQDIKSNLDSSTYAVVYTWNPLQNDDKRNCNQDLLSFLEKMICVQKRSEIYITSNHENDIKLNINNDRYWDKIYDTIDINSKRSCKYISKSQDLLCVEISDDKINTISIEKRIEF